MLPSKRQQAILDLLSPRQRVSVNELALWLNVSRETIRRDLAALDASHLLRKVHGGAIPVQTAREDSFTRRARHLEAEKQRIGARAAALFTAGDSLFVDAGTTTMAFASALAGKDGLTVISNCVEVAARLWRGSGRNRIHLLGGDYSGEASETLGAETVRQASAFHPDHAVIGIGAVDEHAGFMDFNLDEALVAATMVRNARNVTVLAGRDKFGRTGLARVCGFPQATRVVTDAPPAEDIAHALALADVELVVA